MRGELRTIAVAGAAGASSRVDAHSPPAPRDDWRFVIPEAHRRRLRLWLWSIAAMTFGVLVVGGITRLTLSGLSIVDWRPVTGVIPPLNEAQWQRAFDLYRQFPEYLTWRQDMTLGEFKVIYFWEYLHRLLARAIGLVFLVPFAFFWARGYFNRPLFRRALLLFGLGATQGVMGWLMVASGLVDRPSVSHYRLAAHLGLAFAIFGWAVWLARDLALSNERDAVQEPRERPLQVRPLSIVGIVLVAQIAWGALVAGLKAGKYYPTFPLMGGRVVPPDFLWLHPVARNFVENPAAVQWVHRVLGTLLVAIVLMAFTLVRRRVTDPVSRRFGAALAALVGAQYALGVLTLVLLVPVALGVLHQAVALVIFGVWLSWLHHASNARAVGEAAS
jgi:heme a synthase